MLMGRKKYIDKIVTCSQCGREYTEILCEEDLSSIVAFFCEDCGKNVEEILEKSGIGIKPSNMRKRRNTGQSD
jgi:DNA-directed RNA polymerase subunit RPC12/RpoP